MSFSNASRRAPTFEEVPSPSVADLIFERSLHRAGSRYSVTLDRRTGKRALGVIYPKSVSEGEWEEQLKVLSREQGFDQEGHSLERQQAARGRQEEPVSDAETTSITLRRG